MNDLFGETCPCCGQKVSPQKTGADGSQEKAVEAYNAAAERQGWPKVQIVSDARKKKLRSVLKLCGGLEGWQAALDKALASSHCNGQNARGWTINFDFLVTQSSFTKLMEGNYDDRRGAHSTGSGSRAGTRGLGRGTVDAFAAVAAERSGQQGRS